MNNKCLYELTRNGGDKLIVRIIIERVADTKISQLLLYCTLTAVLGSECTPGMIVLN